MIGGMHNVGFYEVIPKFAKEFKLHASIPDPMFGLEGPAGDWKKYAIVGGAALITMALILYKVRK